MLCNAFEIHGRSTLSLQFTRLDIVYHLTAKKYIKTARNE